MALVVPSGVAASPSGKISEKTLGKEHPAVAIRYNNLAGLLEDQGKYAEAEPLYRRAIEIGEKTLGKDHPDVARLYNNLASLLKDRGKFAEAEPLYLRAIEIFQASLGPEHPKTLTASGAVTSKGLGAVN